MNAIELEKTYNPKDFEDRIYNSWMENKEFSPKEENGKNPFTIVIPPPKRHRCPSHGTRTK